MPRRLVQITQTQLIPILKSLHTQDYPRHVSLIELTGAAVYSFGPGVVVWFTWEEEFSVSMHVAITPTKRRRIPAARTLMKEVRAWGEAQGMERILAADCEGDGEVAGYLRRLGWKPCDDRPIWYEMRIADG